jgi:cystine transport system substrate-binding protein
MTEPRLFCAPQLSRRSSLTLLLCCLASPPVLASEEKRTVKVGFLRSYEPFSHVDASGQLRGFDVDVMARLCELMQWRMEPVVDGLAALTRRLQAGDIAWLGNQMLMTPENRRQLDFVRPSYASIQLSSVQHDGDDRDFLSLDDLFGKRLGVLARTGVEEQAREVMGRSVKTYEHIVDALKDLAAKKLDLVLEENLIADYQIEKHRFPLRVAAPFAAPMQVGLGVRKGDREQLEELSRAVRQLLGDGSLRRISDKWFGYDVSRPRTSHTAPH